MRTVSEIIESFPNHPESLIPILQKLQEVHLYLSEEHMTEVAEKLDLPLHHVYSVATFYNVFSLKPKGRNVVRVCMGSACHVRGAGRILEEVERVLQLRDGETSSDGNFSLETVNCVGACALGPVVVLNKNFNGHLTPAKVEAIINEVSEQ